MRADYHSATNAISIVIADAPRADRSDEVRTRAIVALVDDLPVEVQVLYPDDLGISEPLAAVADRCKLDREALAAAAQSALAAPDRVISLEVAARRTTLFWRASGERDMPDVSGAGLRHGYAVDVERFAGRI